MSGCECKASDYAGLCSHHACKSVYRLRTQYTCEYDAYHLRWDMSISVSWSAPCTRSCHHHLGGVVSGLPRKLAHACNTHTDMAQTCQM